MRDTEKKPSGKIVSHVFTILAFSLAAGFFIPVNNAFAVSAPPCSIAFVSCGATQDTDNDTTCLDLKGAYCTAATAPFGEQVCDPTTNAHIGTYTNKSNCSGTDNKGQQSNCAMTANGLEFYRTTRPCTIAKNAPNGDECVVQSQCANLQYCETKNGAKPQSPGSFKDLGSKGCHVGSAVDPGYTCANNSSCEFVRIVKKVKKMRRVWVSGR